MAGRRLRVSLVDLSGEATVVYTPLATMYLRASLEAAVDLADHVEVAIHPFLAGTSLAQMADAIEATAPDLVGLSCQGWNFGVYRQLLPTLRQLLPDAVIVLGGNHVSYQGDRILHQVLDADVVVNGEGENAIRDLAHWLVDEKPDLGEIPGISYRQDGEVVSTPMRPRVGALDEIASAYLTPNALAAGTDVALWETNRGCPYHCSFCFWGGAVGQKLTRAELHRLVAELEVIARAGVSTIFLCDANFGILPRDVEIAKTIVAARRRFGAPTTVHVNWAKNHAERVRDILDILQAGDVHTNVNLAVQTLTAPALKLAGRDERGRSEMMALGHRIRDRGGDVGVELIFGLPGETLTDFRHAYDELFPQFPSLLVHPLWVLPNTTYDTDRDRFGLITIRPDPTMDYEGVLAHYTLSRKDNQAGLRLLLADEILVGTGYGRTTMRGLARWTDHTPTETLDAFADFVATQADPLPQRLAAAFAEINAERYFHRALRASVRGALFADRDRARVLLQAFVNTQIADPRVRDACHELARYDAALLPRADLDGTGHVEETLTTAFDTHAVGIDLLSSAAPAHPPAQQRPVHLRIRHEAGFGRHRSDAIDFAARWRGRVTNTIPCGEFSRPCRHELGAAPCR